MGQGRRTCYSKADANRLMMMWPTWPMADIRKAFPNRSITSLSTKARKMGVKRSKGARYAYNLKVPLETNAIPLIRGLRAERVGQHITLADLAKRTGYGREQMNQWELGKYLPSVRALQNWCDALGLELTLRKKPARVSVKQTEEARHEHPDISPRIVRNKQNLIVPWAERGEGRRPAEHVEESAA